MDLRLSERPIRLVYSNLTRDDHGRALTSSDLVPRPLAVVQASDANLVYKNVVVKNYQVKAIIDTVAGLSVVSDDLARELGSLFPWKGHSVMLANGENLTPVWGIKLRASSEENPEHVVGAEAVVLPLEGKNLLLGNGIIRQLGTLTVTYDDTGLPVVDFQPTGENRSKEKALIASEDVRMPAFAAMAIRVDRKKTFLKTLRRIV